MVADIASGSSILETEQTTLGKYMWYRHCILRRFYRAVWDLRLWMTNSIAIYWSSGLRNAKVSLKRLCTSTSHSPVIEYGYKIGRGRLRFLYCRNFLHRSEPSSHDRCALVILMSAMVQLSIHRTSRQRTPVCYKVSPESTQQVSQFI
jgi:hypothetical protein